MRQLMTTVSSSSDSDNVSGEWQLRVDGLELKGEDLGFRQEGAVPFFAAILRASLREILLRLRGVTSIGLISLRQITCR